MVEPMDGSFIFDIACVESSRRLEQNHPALLLRHRTMFYPTGHHDEFPGLNPFVVILIVHSKSAVNDKKKFVFVIVMMEYKFVFEFHDLYILAVQFSGNVWLPMLANLGEFIDDVDFGR